MLNTYFERELVVVVTSLILTSRVLERSEAALLDLTGTWFFAYPGTEAAVEDVVPHRERRSATALLSNVCATHLGLREVEHRTCVNGTAYELSVEGARRYSDFWLGAQPLATAAGVTLISEALQCFKATVLIPRLPLRPEDHYFSGIWFDACDDWDLEA